MSNIKWNLPGPELPVSAESDVLKVCNSISPQAYSQILLKDRGPPRDMDGPGFQSPGESPEIAESPNHEPACEAAVPVAAIGIRRTRPQIRARGFDVTGSLLDCRG